VQPGVRLHPGDGRDRHSLQSGSVVPGTGGYAGLDFDGTPQEPGVIDNHSVTCVGAKFVSALVEIVVRAESIGEACDHACGSGDCGTGDTARVFAGSAGAYNYLGTLQLTAVWTDYVIPVPGGLPATEVLICRQGWGNSRDDVAVGSIHGSCQP
jgi:hypothetical protein